MLIEVENIPLQLREKPNWVLWRREERDGKPTKIPYQACSQGEKARSDDPTTWTDFGTACKNANGSFDGIGIMAGKEPAGLVFIDLDHCIKADGSVEPWALAIVRAADSYTEYSPSGDGLHVFCGGELPGPSIKTPKSEIYAYRRYFTITGKIFQNFHQYRTLTAGEIEKVYRLVEATRPAKPPQQAKQACNGSDSSLLQAMFKARNGAAMQALYRGDVSAYGGDQSAADLALCNALAFWTKRDAARMDAIFRSSGLMRQKWDQKHYADGRLYGEATIEKAIAACTECYGERREQKEGKQPVIKVAGITFSDSWAAEFLRSNFGDKLRYNHTAAKWLLWDGKRWQYDETGALLEIAKESARKIYNVAKDFEGNEYSQVVRFALRSEQRAGLLNATDLAKCLPGIALTQTDFDKDPLVVNLQNGQYDLRQNQFAAHNPDSHLTKIAGADFNEWEQCPQWDAFLQKIFNGDVDLIQFVQRAVGYSLSGLTSEQCLFFLFGHGANGKSVFSETLRMLLCDYWLKAPSEMLMTKDYHVGGASSEVARLTGSRVAVASELQEAQRFDEALLKDLTGGDVLTARFLYGEYFQFLPTHKLWIYGNHKPTVRGQDTGVWRRIMLIPFLTTIPESERVPMPELLDRFRGELSGILNWALAGWRDYRAHGLRAPAAVRAATDEYRRDSDVIEKFLTEQCAIDKQHEIDNPRLYEAYKLWCKSMNEYCLNGRRFTAKLREKGFISAKRGSKVIWSGITTTDSGW